LACVTASSAILFVVTALASILQEAPDEATVMSPLSPSVKLPPPPPPPVLASSAIIKLLLDA